MMPEKCHHKAQSERGMSLSRFPHRPAGRYQKHGKEVFKTAQKCSLMKKFSKTFFFFFCLKCSVGITCQLPARANPEINASTIVHIAADGGYYQFVLHSLLGGFIFIHFRGKGYAIMF